VIGELVRLHTEVQCRPRRRTVIVSGIPRSRPRVSTRWTAQRDQTAPLRGIDQAGTETAGGFGAIEKRMREPVTERSRGPGFASDYFRTAVAAPVEGRRAS
jgi:hypothetical protein